MDLETAPFSKIRTWSFNFRIESCKVFRGRERGFDGMLAKRRPREVPLLELTYNMGDVSCAGHSSFPISLFPPPNS